MSAKVMRLSFQELQTILRALRLEQLSWCCDPKYVSDLEVKIGEEMGRQHLREFNQC